MKKVIELRAAEGGEDSKLFLKDLAKAYLKTASSLGWESKITYSSEQKIYISLSGKDLSKLKLENGGHRIQRVPPTERKGRVHTSTITVAVMDEQKKDIVNIEDKDLDIQWYSGTGAGGQHRNKHQNSCRIKHIPTGLISTSQCRSRKNSYNEAKQSLFEKLQQMNQEKQLGSISCNRKNKIGSGYRGDKIRTYNFQTDRVVDHNTNKKASCSKVMSGKINKLWN